MRPTTLLPLLPLLLSAGLPASAAPPRKGAKPAPAAEAKPELSPVDRLYREARELIDEEKPGALEALQKLEKAFPGHARSLDARKRYEAPFKTRAGMPAPPFRIPSLEDPKVEYTVESFKGRYLLLEFWATWCPFCVKELPELHKVHAQFKDRGLEILSLSLDQKPEDVAPFRAQKQPMPWKHAFLPGAKAHPMAEAYGAAGIPRYVLVGPDGVVLASGMELKPEQMPALLDRLMPRAAGEAAQEVQGLLKAAEGKTEAIMKARQAFVDKGGQSRAFKADCTQELAALRGRLSVETRPEVRAALLLSERYHQTLAKQDPRPGQLDQILKEVPPTCPLWSLDPDMTEALVEHDAKAGEAYLAEMRRAHPDPEVRRALLVNAVYSALDRQDEAGWKPALETLRKEHAGTREAKLAERFVEGFRKTAPGLPAPAFSLPSMDDPARQLGPAAFKGKYLLIDFWATWCPGCRAELPVIHKAYERFKGKSFDILSVSFDRKPEHVPAFRKEPKTPMPWNHVFMPGGFTNPISNAYGVVAIPKPVLVGPDGKIVAGGSALQGEELEKTLERLLGK